MQPLKESDAVRPADPVMQASYSEHNVFGNNM